MFFVAQEKQKNKKFGEKLKEKLNQNQSLILNSIEMSNYFLAKDIALKIGVSSRNVKENLAKLKSFGLLKKESALQREVIGK